ncbi:MAG: hypothetical protein WBM97_11135 [Sedimenticolaceae bacterium]
MNLMVKVSLALLVTVLANPAEPSTRDLHRLWDDRCAACHGHSGEFSRQFLRVSDGELQGPHHLHELRRFLANHYVSDNEVDAVYDMLLAQANSPPRFKNECSECHDSAANFVRHSMGFSTGVLVSQKTGRPVREFLGYHMKLSPDDVQFFADLLTRVANEIYRP